MLTIPLYSLGLQSTRYVRRIVPCVVYLERLIGANRELTTVQQATKTLMQRRLLPATRFPWNISGHHVRSNSMGLAAVLRGLFFPFGLFCSVSWRQLARYCRCICNSQQDEAGVRIVRILYIKGPVSAQPLLHCGQIIEPSISLAIL